MGFEIFSKEQAALERAKGILDAGFYKGDEAEHFAELLKAYEKLFKSTRRLVRLSDRNEEELNRLAKTLDEKSNMLEDLSHKLAKYLSPQVYDAIFSGRSDAALTTSRKKLTVFFSDIKDFTSTTADLQPEDLTYLLNDYFSVMSGIAIKYGATIDKFIGDAMLMFFGDPESKGVAEDAHLCVKMAIEMQQRMQELEHKWQADGFTRPFKMRVGVNTGYCNVGNFGSEQRMDYTIIGGEVNLAARLESAADPGGILMSHETYALVKDLVDVEERDKITMKGIRREVRAFSVKNIYDAKQKVMIHEDEGLSLMLKPDSLKGASRREAVKQLQAALKLLEEKKAAPAKKRTKPKTDA